ncbi:MAG: CHAT domain-containing protein [Cyanobacteria bacterium CRU_2_1]|nr:CHAT domain-containing protein [Cyanobacteria bacterium CRU_2_1]
METHPVRNLIEAIITAATISEAIDRAWSNRQILLSPQCFRVLMDMLKAEQEQQGNSRRYEALTRLKQYRTALFQARLQNSENPDDRTIAATLPELIVVPLTVTVENVIQLFKSGDINARKAFFAELLPADLANEVVFSPQLDLALRVLNIRIEPYCRGVDIELGVTLSKAVYQLSQQVFDENLNRDYLYTAKGGARNYAIALMASGHHFEVLQFTTEAIQWLEARESRDMIAELLLNQVETHLILAQANKKQIDQFHFKQAEVLLEQTDWQSLIPADRPADRWQKIALEERLNKLIDRVIVLRRENPNHVEMEKQTRHDVLEKFKSLTAISSPEDEELEELFKRAETVFNRDIDKDIPDSQDEWIVQTQRRMDAMSHLLSGGSLSDVITIDEDSHVQWTESDLTQFEKPIRNRIQLQQRIRHASLSFSLKQQPEFEKIEQARVLLTDALKWAKEHNFPEEENSALWGLYLYYNHIGEYPPAVEALQTLWTNLEIIRGRIANPLERAGIMDKFPNLFSRLCQLLHRIKRPAELLQAIEGGKGRYLADVLLKRTHQLEQDQSFAIPAQFLQKLQEQGNAHYLTYFVGDEETYAVLIAKDGTFHIPNDPIPLGQTQLKQWLHYDNKQYNPLNPKSWGSFISGARRVIKDLPERLAPLISWLEDLVERSILQQDDHLCYCPDEQLHLIPLHYIPFRGEPLVKLFSISRIHGAAALTAILNRKPLRPAQYTAVHISAQSDRDPELNNIAEKLAAFRRVPDWLKQSRLTGQIVAEAEADLPTVAALPLKQRLVHFATHGIFPDWDTEGRAINPYENSGLLLAQHGQLPVTKEGTTTPTSQQVFDRTLDLTPQQVFDRKLDFWGSHVTLSACVSGLSKEGIGGDALGLEWALLQAGATSLLATHWNAYVESVAEFSEMFYQKWLFEGVSRAVAWRETVLNLMQKNPLPEHHVKHPEFFWAAFSLSGDWR